MIGSQFIRGRGSRDPLRRAGEVAAGDSIDETGLLLRDGGGFVLQRDRGGRLPLDLARVPVDLVGKQVRLVGIEGAGGRVEVDGARAA